jgi:vacuolar-type H+-ATPase subunit F/Vma7
MIVLATEELAVGLKLAGVKESYYIKDRKEAYEILSKLNKKELIIATHKIIELVPQLRDYPNLISFPDKILDFSNIDDLKNIAKKAIGSEVEI